MPQQYETVTSYHLKIPCSGPVNVQGDCHRFKANGQKVKIELQCIDGM